VESGRAAAIAERAGVPTVMVTREGFSGAVAAAFAGMSFPAEASQVMFPVRMFLTGSDLTPIQQRLDELIAGLTTWKPASKEKRVITPPRIRIKGEDYAEAAANVNKLFLRNMWTDGLPITPPTRECVNWILTGTDLSPDKVVARILPRGGIVNVETLAVNLAMAGGRPEYMPVLVAAVEAISNPHFQHQRMNATTCSGYPVVIVNGSMAEQIRLNSGYGCLGPDPMHPAGAAIGRAIRFILQGAGGAIPGVGTMSIHGGPARYASIVFAEDEGGLPQGWDPLSVDQGFSRNTNTVTTYAVSSTTNVPGGETSEKEIALASLNQAAMIMGVPNGNYWLHPYNEEGTAGILVMASGTAEGLAGLGWSKEAVKTYLWEHSKIPSSKLGPRMPVWWSPRENIRQDPMPICMSPKGIKIAVAGGLQSGHMMWFQVGCCPERMTSAEIELPANWEDLLQKAEDDLGPPPARRR
jgi:hypothetical protein